MMIIKLLNHWKNLIISNYYIKNNGYGAALIEGFNSCETEYCCIINADGSMDPKYLAEMLEECQNKDLIFGSRYKPDGGSEDDTLVTFLVINFLLLFQTYYII